MAKIDETLQGKKKAFLAAYAEVGTITRAAELAGISRQTHYDWLESDPNYPEMFKEADKQACDRLEQEARRRAVQGVSKPVFYKGEECGVVQEYSDTLLIFLLKGALPDKYKDRVQQEVTNIDVPGGKDAVNSLRELKKKQNGQNDNSTDEPTGPESID